MNHAYRLVQAWIKLDKTPELQRSSGKRSSASSNLGVTNCLLAEITVYKPKEDGTTMKLGSWWVNGPIAFCH